MHRYYLDYSLNAACEMIQAYYVDKNVAGIAKHLDKENFSWYGQDAENFIDNAEKFIKYAADSLKFMSSYKLIDENYSVIGDSQDSCYILAKIKLTDTRTQKISDVHFFFCFNQFGNITICRHYHFTIPTNSTVPTESIFFNKNFPIPFFQIEIQQHKEELLDFINSKAVAEKSFYYAENFPYRFVNHKFINMLGYDKSYEFVTEENNSILANIHVSDQRRYVEYLRTVYENNIKNFRFNQKYQYQSSYCVSYRLKSPYLHEEIFVFEWGNFFTLNGRTIVNCLVFNFNEAENISLGNDNTASEPNLIQENFGIRIGKKIIAYPASHQIKIEDETIELTKIESEIFLLFANKLNQPINIEEIYLNIWNNEELQMTSNSLRMHISNIRHKLNPYKNLIRLNTVRNKGYCLQTY